MSEAHLATLAAVALKLAAKSGRELFLQYCKNEFDKINIGFILSKQSINLTFNNLLKDYNYYYVT